MVDICNRRGRALRLDQGDAVVRRSRVPNSLLAGRVAVALDPVAAVPKGRSGGAEAEEERHHSGGAHRRLCAARASDCWEAAARDGGVNALSGCKRGAVYTDE